MTDIPRQYAWLETEPGPRILVEALKTYGTIEKPGEGSNPSIMSWAKVTGLDRIYRNDATAWCGLWMAYVVLQAGWDVPMNPLGARIWLAFGVPQQTLLAMSSSSGEAPPPASMATWGSMSARIRKPSMSSVATSPTG